ncbi:LAMI_0A01508g1_1 [Lachancea mirantina]|uniref:LAMI_0A01508g1_1 n=1 Tax=Lachancea mirantina TaxID=1230905 RepID=A0A1G4IMD6_9SACH|nr:LAMI_0A01508g1_1 [Lachancea mirantina]
MTTIAKVRAWLVQGKDLSLFDGSGEPTDDIVQAKQVVLGPDEKLDLDNASGYVIDGEDIPLRIVLHCWQNRGSSAADYVSDCERKQLRNVSFLQRTDLIRWLSGESESSSYIEEEASNRKNATAELNDEPASVESGVVTDPLLTVALANEQTVLDHNCSLRGSKSTNFNYLIREAELKLVHSLKSSRRSGKGGESKGISKEPGLRKLPKKDPIILIPSAASSIFTVDNIKQFLEDSVFIPSRAAAPTNKDVTTVTKQLDRFAKPIKFLIVNNTRLFTKPEYWDRVIAVFTTGHAWQFNSYQWSEPSELFQRCKGYYFYFSGDVVPKHVEQWNVQKIELDKNKRFRDVEVLRLFWNSIEKELVARGYH